MACMIQEAGAMEAFSSTRTFLYLVHHYKPLVRPIHTPTTTTAATTTTTTISREDGDGDDDNDDDADKDDFYLSGLRPVIAWSMERTKV